MFEKPREMNRERLHRPLPLRYRPDVDQKSPRDARKLGWVCLPTWTRWYESPSRPTTHPPRLGGPASDHPPTCPTTHPPSDTPNPPLTTMNASKDRHFERQLRGTPPRKQQNTHAVVLVSQLYGLIRSHRPIDANGWIGLWNRFSKKRRSQAELYLARSARRKF